MKISTEELDGLIRFINSQPYRPLGVFESKMLKRFTKEQEKRKGNLKKDFYVIAKAIRASQGELPKSDNGSFAREVIQAVAHRIASELIRYNRQFDAELFLHSCGVEV